MPPKLRFRDLLLSLRRYLRRNTGYVMICMWPATMLLRKPQCPGQSEIMAVDIMFVLHELKASVIFNTSARDQPLNKQLRRTLRSVTNSSTWFRLAVTTIPFGDVQPHPWTSSTS